MVDIRSVVCPSCAAPVGLSCAESPDGAPVNHSGRASAAMTDALIARFGIVSRFGTITRFEIGSDELSQVEARISQIARVGDGLARAALNDRHYDGPDHAEQSERTPS